MGGMSDVDYVIVSDSEDEELYNFHSKPLFIRRNTAGIVHDVDADTASEGDSLESGEMEEDFYKKEETESEFYEKASESEFYENADLNGKMEESESEENSVIFNTVFQKEEEAFISFEPTDPAEEQEPKKTPNTTPRRVDKSIKTSSFLQEAPWLKKPSLYSANAIERLHQEIVDFAEYLQPTQAEQMARDSVIHRITRVVEGKWPSAKVLCFGSFESRLFLPSSDIDLVIEMKGVGKDSLRKLARLLIHGGICHYSTVKVISRARIPIVKIVDKTTNYKVDLSFNTASGIETIEVIKSMLIRQPAMKPLLLVMKQFLFSRALNEVVSGGLGSYSLLLMVYAFLELHPFIQAKWICPLDNLGVLLLDFLEFYGRLFYYNKAKITFSLDSNGMLECALDERLSTNDNAYFCIEDPLNSENIVSKGTFSMATVKSSFEHAFNLLSSLVREMNSDCYYDAENERWKNRNYHKDLLFGKSLLSLILSFDEESVRHRHWINSTFPCEKEDKKVPFTAVATPSISIKKEKKSKKKKRKMESEGKSKRAKTK